MVERAQPDRSGLNGPLDAILSKALSKNAAARYPSARDMDADLARYLEGQRVHARKPRRKLWAALAAAMALCACGVLAVRLLRVPQHTAALGPFDAGVPNPMEPALSFDGKWLAFASARDAGAHSDIWLKRMPGGPARRVTDVDAVNDEPSLSPDGRWLAFHSTRAPAGIYLQPVLPAGSGGPAKLLAAGGRVPRFSPDGQWISYMNVGESGADIHASNSSMLYRIPAQGGTPIRVARNVPSVMGSAWSAGGRNLLILAIDESLALQLWSVPADGGPATLIPDFVDPRHSDGLVCGVTQDRLLYTAFEGNNGQGLEQFSLLPARGVNRVSHVSGPPHSVITTCTASGSGSIVAGESTSQSSVWVLPLTAETAEVHGPPAPLTEPQSGNQIVQLTSDGASFFADSSAGQLPSKFPDRRAPGNPQCKRDEFRWLIRPRDDRTCAQRANPKSKGPESQNRGIRRTDADWRRALGIFRAAANGCLPPACRCTVRLWPGTPKPPSISPSIRIPAPTCTWPISRTMDAGRCSPRSKAANSRACGPRLFADFENVPASEWVDLGEGDYPRWSPGGGRIYFTQRHDGFECIFTRAVDRRTKRPVGPVTAVQHFHQRLTPRGVPAGNFRISVAQDKISFTLGERLYRLYRWQ